MQRRARKKYPAAQNKFLIFLYASASIFAVNNHKGEKSWQYP